MEQKQKQNRIRLSIQMPSMALQRFIEKALKDDEFFESAVENPLGALKESGVRLNVSAFTPEDLATFLGALAGAKELIRKKDIKEITFEKIFGQAAEIRGTTLMAETHRGMWTLFNRNALMDKEMFASVKLNFETLQETNALKDTRLFATATRDLRNLAIRDIGNLAQGRFELDMAGIGDVATKADITTDRKEDTLTRQDQQQRSNITREGASIIEQLLDGPLINPVDLAVISAKIETYINAAEQMEQF